MKNLFDYATKELSQDAFLCWLFANYDCENKKVAEIAVKLLSQFSFELSAEKITNLQIFKQWKYIDVLIQFVYEGKTHLIAIEDKTLSEEHEQLKKYDAELGEYIKSIKHEVVCHKVFYKTAILYEQENNRVKTSDGWKIFDIQRIYNFFSTCSTTESDILDDYIAHINELYSMLYHYKEIDFKKWKGNNFIFKQYCEIDIRQKVEGISLRSEIYQGKYMEACLQKITKDNIVVELKFFFRDSEISAWIKCWENKKLHNVLNYVLRDKIRNSLPSNLITQWEHKIYKNRILRVEKQSTEFESFQVFDSWVDKCIIDFENIVKNLRV